MHRLWWELESARRQFALTATMAITPTLAHPTVTMALNISPAEFSSAPGRGSMAGAGAGSTAAADFMAAVDFMVAVDSTAVGRSSAGAHLLADADSLADMQSSADVDSHEVAPGFTAEVDSEAARHTVAVAYTAVAVPMEVGVGK